MQVKSLQVLLELQEFVSCRTPFGRWMGVIPIHFSLPLWFSREKTVRSACAATWCTSVLQEPLRYGFLLSGALRHPSPYEVFKTPKRFKIIKIPPSPGR